MTGEERESVCVSMRVHPLSARLADLAISAIEWSLSALLPRIFGVFFSLPHRRLERFFPLLLPGCFLHESISHYCLRLTYCILTRTPREGEILEPKGRAHIPTGRGGKGREAGREGAITFMTGPARLL